MQARTEATPEETTRIERYIKLRAKPKEQGTLLIDVSDCSERTGLSELVIFSHMRKTRKGASLFVEIDLIRLAQEPTTLGEGGGE